MESLLIILGLSLVVNVWLLCRYIEWRERYRRLMSDICPDLD